MTFLALLLIALALAYALWLHRRQASPSALGGRAKWQVFEVSFEMRGSAACLEATFAYVLAPDEAGVLPLVKAELKRRGYEFLALIDPPKLIPLEQLDTYLARTWPEFLKQLPTRSSLLRVPSPARVYLLPSIRAAQSPGH
jgi:hypothetical protein